MACTSSRHHRHRGSRADPSCHAGRVRRPPATVISLATATVAATVSGYLLGSVPVARLVARRHGIEDLRVVGDRNPGYWNLRLLAGPTAARPVLVGDIAKGALAAVLGRVLIRRWWAPYVGGGAAMVGHAFPLFDARRGGRSVLTFVGTMAVASPAAAALAVVGVLGPVGAASGRFDVAARAAVFGFPVTQLLVEPPRRVATTGALMSFIGVRFAQARRADVDPATGSSAG